MSMTGPSSPLRGIGVSAGMCWGKTLRYETELEEVPQERAADREAELRRVTEAWAQVESDLQSCYEAAAQRELTEADVFLAHLMLLTDESSLLLPIQERIRTEGWTAPWAAQCQFDQIIRKMASGADAYLRERAADMEDLKEQVLRRMLGREKTAISALGDDVILVARDLAPSDTIRMDLNHVKGVVCEAGGVTSHTALLARSMGIPAVMGCTDVMERVSNGQTLLVDGDTGDVFPSPPEEMLRAQEERRRMIEKERQALEKLRGRATVTADGRPMHIYANIARPEEAERALAGDCEGVGLFRSEFLYLGRQDLPDEEEQYRAYASVLETMAGRPVTIRTLDVGGDKEFPLLGAEKEDNPFLGFRAIRLCLERRDIFLTQLRALYRASACGNLRIMFPMIATMEELRAAKACAAEARRQLKAEGVSFQADVPLGMMMEIPSAAVMAEWFAKEADFFSIGTNDLIQYTMAADRGNAKVANLYTPFQPAVICLIQNVIRAAKAAGIDCCLCGGAAEDMKFLPTLVAMEIPGISVSPPNALRLRQQILGLSAEEGARLLGRMAGACTVAETCGGEYR